MKSYNVYLILINWSEYRKKVKVPTVHALKKSISLLSDFSIIIYLDFLPVMHL